MRRRLGGKADRNEQSSQAGFVQRESGRTEQGAVRGGGRPSDQLHRPVRPTKYLIDRLVG